MGKVIEGKADDIARRYRRPLVLAIGASVLGEVGLFFLLVSS